VASEPKGYEPRGYEPRGYEPRGYEPRGYEPRGYEVELRESEQGWRVAIVDPTGTVVRERACRDRSEARTFASTVRQHIGWLSAERFRTYYQL
jgi:hypothetical protein